MCTLKHIPVFLRSSRTFCTH